ncbi:MAG: hypothetical protein N2C14_19475, partial [Planctomycetales bacterium]
ETGKAIRQFAVPDTKYSRIAYSKDRSRAAISSSTAIRVYDLEKGIGLHTFQSQSQSFSRLNCLEISPDGKFAATAMERDGSPVQIWDMKSGQLLRDLKTPQGFTQSLAFLPDSYRLLTGGSDKILRIWNVKSGAEMRRFEGAAVGPGGICLSPNGYLVVTMGGSKRGPFALWGLP